MAAKGKVNGPLERAVKKMLADVMADQNATLTDRCKVIDRALKLEAIRLKIDDSGYGSGFQQPDEDENEKEH